MRVSIDSNVWISAVVMNSDICKKVIGKCVVDDCLVIPEEIVQELLDTTFNKFVSPEKKKHLSNVFDAILKSADEIPLKTKYVSNSKINDKKDKVILDSIIAANVEMFITGDKDFFVHKYDNIRVLTPHDFLRKFDSH